MNSNDRNMSGALFKNETKEKPNHPDYKGDVTINGRKLWISAWIKTSEKTGKKYMSLALREAEEQQNGKPRQPTRDQECGPTPHCQNCQKPIRQFWQLPPGVRFEPSSPFGSFGSAPPKPQPVATAVTH